MDIFSNLDYKLTGIKKFYFLEYFYILLYCIDKYSGPTEAFENFKILKETYQLGESKYKRLSFNLDELESKLENRYRYTFNQIRDESLLYDLIEGNNDGYYQLTLKGTALLKTYNDRNSQEFYYEIFKLIEEKTNGFNFLVNFCYKTNAAKGGLLIFPIYSPLKLGFSKAELRTRKKLLEYLAALYKQLEEDVQKYLAKEISLEEANYKLIGRLEEGNFIDYTNDSEFDPRSYNMVMKRIRDYWLGYFLKDIYNINFSLSYFDLWSYRAKQLNILNTTEFYPHFSGRIVYPISIITKDVKSNDFKRMFGYPNEDILFIHNPVWETFQEQFVANVYESYHDLKRSNRSYFLSLQDLREVVCYKTKISYEKFVEFLTIAYNLNLRNQLKIKISLEADKLPDENNAMYLRREPIVIEGKTRNIIAIDLK